MKRILVGVFILSISIILALFSMSAVASPDEGADCNSCHDEGDYEISADKTTINAPTSTEITITIKASGDDLIVEAPEDARDNDKFDFDEDIIEDNDANDEDSDSDEIEYEFEIMTPNKEGEYILLIISRESEDSGRDTPLEDIEIEVNVGRKTPLELFFDHNNYYLGGLTLIFMSFGLIVFHTGVNRKNEYKKSVQKKNLSESLVQDNKEEKSTDIEEKKDIGLFQDKTRGFFIAIALILVTVNTFLIINTSITFTYGLIESIILMESRELSDLSNLQDLSQLILIILGSIGYIAGIIVVFGTFTNVPGHRLKLPKYIMSLVWIFNFLYGIFIISSILI